MDHQNDEIMIMNNNKNKNRYYKRSKNYIGITEAYSI